MRVESVGNVKVVRDESSQSMAVEVSSWGELAANCDIRTAASILVTPVLKRPKLYAGSLLRNHRMKWGNSRREERSGSC